MIANARIAAPEFKHIARAMNAVIERRNTIPVLGEVRTEISAGKVTFRATDLDMCLTMEAEAETEGSATFLMNGQQMTAFASAMSDYAQMNYEEPETGSLTGQRVIELRSDDITLRILDRMPVTDFPVMTFPEQKSWRAGAGSFTATQEDLKRVLTLGRHCISKMETRYYLNGAFLTTKPDGNTLRGVTTDGHRMAVIDTPIELDKEIGILPAKTLDIIARLLTPGANEPVSCQYKDNQLVLSLDGLEIAAKMIDGQYPDYTRVIPSAADAGEAQLSKVSIARLASLAKGFQDGPHRPVKQDLPNGSMSMSTPFGGEAATPLQGRGAFVMGLK